MQNREKYPKSTNGTQCIGPCYKKGTSTIHPLVLRSVKNEDHAFCHIPPQTVLNEKGQQVGVKLYEECKTPTTDKYDIMELEMKVLIPTVNFSSEYFLNIYYGITSISEYINWLIEAKNKPLATRLRVTECVWREFMKDTKVIDDKVIDLYVEAINKNWINIIFPKVKEHIHVNNGKIKLGKKKDVNDKHDPERKAYFINNFASKNFVYKFFLYFIDENKENWDNIVYFTEHILLSYEDYIIKKINVSI